MDLEERPRNIVIKTLEVSLYERINADALGVAHRRQCFNLTGTTPKRPHPPYVENGSMPVTCIRVTRMATILTLSDPTI